MHRLGAVFRNRYVRPSRHDEHVGIVGIQAKTIDNSQLYIESSTDGCSSASAAAFMQGLYPPFPHVPCDSDVPEYARFADGSILNYPMSGYQYPVIRTVAPDRDPDSIWSRGHGLCKKHEASLLAFPNNTMADALHHNSKALYGRLWDKVFHEAFPLSEANFFNAHELYEYAAYRWTHDNRTRASVTFGDLERLRELAWQEQALKYGTASGSDHTRGDLTSAVAGRTLLSRAAALFAENIASHGERNKLNLAFTSHEPFLSFFSLSGLTTGVSSHLFSQMPDPSATLTFELFSVDSGETTGSRGLDLRHDTSSYSQSGSDGKAEPCSRVCPTNDAEMHSNNHSSGATASCKSETDPDYGDAKMCAHGGKGACAYNGSLPSPYDDPSSPSSSSIAYPSVDKLYVRFLYRNGSADPSAPSALCPLFGSDRLSMSFKHFNESVWNIGIANAAEWCGVCESDAFFCKGAEARQKPHHHLAAILGASSSAVVLLLLNFLT